MSSSYGIVSANLSRGSTLQQGTARDSLCLAAHVVTRKYIYSEGNCFECGLWRNCCFYTTVALDAINRLVLKIIIIIIIIIYLFIKTITLKTVLYNDRTRHNGTLKFSNNCQKYK